MVYIQYTTCIKCISNIRIELLQNPIQNSGCQKARVQQIGSKTKHVTQFVLSVSIDGIEVLSILIISVYYYTYMTSFIVHNNN